LEAAFEDAKHDMEPTALIHALGTAARAREFLQTAKESSRYQTLVKNNDPLVSAVSEAVQSLGYRLAVVPR